MDVSYRRNRPGYSVRLDGGPMDHGHWLIHGVVSYHTDLALESRSDVEDEARRELLSAVSRASQSARSQGARSVHVAVDGDDEIAGFFRMVQRRDRTSPRR